jgi:magnesium chelatase family protein
MGDDFCSRDAIRLRGHLLTLATNGVLFLDELGEFPSVALDTLRQPLEEGQVRVYRARHAVCMPARCLLVAAMNPCPCGEGAELDACRCSEAARTRYERRLSGPLLDRFDLRVVVSRPEVSELLGDRAPQPSAVVAARVAAARRRAAERNARCNAELTQDQLDQVARLTADARRLVEHRLRSGRLSARGLIRVQRVARTVADLAAEDDGVVDEGAVAAALELRADIALLGAA